MESRQEENSNLMTRDSAEKLTLHDEFYSYRDKDFFVNHRYDFMIKVPPPVLTNSLGNHLRQDVQFMLYSKSVLVHN
mgnify:CR=1 FL=1